MLRSLAVVLLVCCAVPSTWAAEPAPILDDRDSATRLEPTPGGFDDPAAAVLVASPDPEPEPEPGTEPWWSLATVHARWVTVPSFLLDLLFENHPGYSNLAMGVGYEFGSPQRAMWVIDVDWTALIPDNGNWRTSGDPPAGSTYVDSSLHMLSADLSYLRYVSFFDSFQFFIGGGLGVAFLVGDLTFAEVLPTCEDPISGCAHWRSATSEAADLPTRILPVLHVTTGLQVEIGDDVMIRLSAGFRNVFYAGLTVGMSL